MRSDQDNVTVPIHKPARRESRAWALAYYIAAPLLMAAMFITATNH